jgi:GNAT superfamily N-acetyltransferase
MTLSTKHSEETGLQIREIDATSRNEIDLVAQRMQATLVEVEGEANAASLHTPEWIRERLLWHVSGCDVLAKVLVVTIDDGAIIGHTVLRREVNETGAHFGLFSTTYVLPAYRSTGVANRLLQAGEQWFAGIGLSSFCTWTSASNAKLLHLYQGNGYEITDSGSNEITGTTMVKLSKIIRRPASAA